MSQGWDEAYESEWDYLTNTIDMTLMEVESRQYQIAYAEKDIVETVFELEELENDLDDAQIVAVDEAELMRRRQIERGEKLLRRKRQADIRRQKNRWTVKSNRSNILTRNTRDPVLAAKAKTAMSLDDIITVRSPEHLNAMRFMAFNIDVTHPKMQ